MRTVLLIEDNFEIRENTTELLELAGYKVLNAVNGADGISLAKETLPDVVLCDIMMPETNGYDVFRGLKAHDNTRSIPFIFVTASAEKSEMQAGIAMGAAGYIRKPFEEQ